MMDEITVLWPQVIIFSKSAEVLMWRILHALQICASLTPKSIVSAHVPGAGPKCINVASLVLRSAIAIWAEASGLGDRKARSSGNCYLLAWAI